MSKPVQIFLCHASEDKPKVIEVYHFLKQQGFKPWLDKEDLLPGQRWDQEIPKALKASDFILIFFSQTSVSKRGYVQKEFKLALEVLEEIPEGQIFVIPVRLDMCAIPERFSRLHYCDLFENGGLEKVVRAIRASLQSGHQEPATTPAVKVQPSILLRATPIFSLSREAAQKMILEYGFTDVELNRFGKGLQHQYEVVNRNSEKLVIDHTTSLMWQQSGSEESMIFADAQNYVEKLNRDKFAGFSDWRFPTLEETMSLMEPERSENGLYIAPIFDKAQNWIWTADKEPSGRAWYVSFESGSSNGSMNGRIYVRAVRSVHSTI